MATRQNNGTGTKRTIPSFGRAATKKAWLRLCWTTMFVKQTNTKQLKKNNQTFKIQTTTKYNNINNHKNINSFNQLCYEYSRSRANLLSFDSTTSKATAVIQVKMHSAHWRITWQICGRQAMYKKCGSPQEALSFPGPRFWQQGWPFTLPIKAFSALPEYWLDGKM